MEDVLDVYQRPYDPKYPVVCLDETNRQLIEETRLPMEPGKPERVDYEYRRCGVANLFMAFEPLAAKRRVEVTSTRTAVDFAQFVRTLVDEQYPNAEKIVLVMDNLNTHTSASFYKAFEPEEARRLAAKLEIHYTPKHGSWLNMAEIEIGVLSRQCLAKAFTNSIDMQRETCAWEEARNQQHASVNWHFTSPDARIKLKRLYPSISIS